MTGTEVLEARLRARYPLVEARRSVAGRCYRLLRPAEVELGPDTDPNAIPFWMDLWDSAEALAGFLTERRDSLPSEALELGCGLGLVGLIVAAAGVRVVATDCFPDALAFTRLNAARNGVELSCVAVDWRRFALRGRFGLVFGSDLLYEPTLHAALESSLQASLAAGGVAYLADPSRRYGLEFAAGLEARGWRVALHPWGSAGSPGPPIVIYEVRPPRGVPGP